MPCTTNISQLASTVCLAACAAPALAQCPSTFTAGAAWPAGNPSSVCVGDFNSDGRRDFAVANFGGSGALVRLADANQPDTFLAAVSFPLGLWPRGSVVGDFNRDGRDDFAVAYYGGSPSNARMAVFLSNPNGTFPSPTLYPIGSLPQDVRTVDLNGDGKLDLLTPTSFNTLSVLIGNGNGTFQFNVSFGIGAPPAGFAMADLTGDGTYELVTTLTDGPPNVRVMIGVPGTFGTGYGAPIGYTVPGAAGSWGIAAGDFNGDGRTDVVATHRTSNQVGVLLSSAGGVLTPQAVQSTGGTQPQAVATGDFNGDGKLDAAVANWGSGSVAVLLGDGAGGMGSRSEFAVGVNPTWLVVADMNNDDKPDVVVANQTSGTVQILFNTVPVSSFTTQPQSLAVCPGGASSAQFTAAATTTRWGGVTGYRWQGLIDGAWTDLVDGPLAGVGTVGSSSAQTLSVSGVLGNPGGTVLQVRATALTTCGPFASEPALLTLRTQCGGRTSGAWGACHCRAATARWTTTTSSFTSTCSLTAARPPMSARRVASRVRTDSSTTTTSSCSSTCSSAAARFSVSASGKQGPFAIVKLRAIGFFWHIAKNPVH